MLGIVHNRVEQMFMDAVKENDLKWGGISVEDSFRVEEIEEELSKILERFVSGNKEEDNE